MDDHTPLTDRLHALGRAPMPQQSAARHLSSLPPPRRRALGPIIATGVAVLALGSAAVASPSLNLSAFDVSPAQQPDDVPPVPGDDDICVGPPPFAGEEPESGEARAQEAEELEAAKAEAGCDEEIEGEGSPPEGTPPLDEGCFGPPPFAEEEPESGEARAAEAQALAEFRASCDRPGEAGEAGVPEGVPFGAPEGTPDGAPGGVPSGAPEGTPDGAPGGVPSGAPEGTPDGAPDGVPSGAPEGTPDGAPDGTPSGPPAGGAQQPAG